MPIFGQKSQFGVKFGRFWAKDTFFVGMELADFPAVFFHISHWYFSWNKSKSQESFARDNQLTQARSGTQIPIFQNLPNTDRAWTVSSGHWWSLVEPDVRVEVGATCCSNPEQPLIMETLL